MTKSNMKLNRVYSIKNSNEIGTGTEQSKLPVTSETVEGRECSILTNNTTYYSTNHWRKGV